MSSDLEADDVNQRWQGVMAEMQKSLVQQFRPRSGQPILDAAGHVLLISIAGATTHTIAMIPFRILVCSLSHPPPCKPSMHCFACDG